MVKWSLVLLHLLFSNFVLGSEASAALQGLRSAISLDFQNVVMEIDSKQVFLSNKNPSKCCLGNLPSYQRNHKASRDV
jgi:hypothetical protein